MEQWLILSDIVHYVQYDRNPKNHRKIYDRLKEVYRHVLDLDFDDNPDKLKEEYLDMYERVQSKVLSTTEFDENSDLSMTYLDRIDITRASKMKAEERFPISEQGITVGRTIRWHGM